MVTMDSVLDVVQGRYPYPWAKDRQITLTWLIWFIKNRYAICVSDDYETISGLALFRPVMRPEDGHVAYRHDPEGPIIYCDFLYAADNRAMRGLIVEGTHRFGARPTAAWMRRGKLRSYSARRFVGHILPREPEIEECATN